MCECYSGYLDTTKSEKMKELFSEAYMEYTLDKFIATQEFQRQIKIKAEDFLKTKGANSILFLGQSGSGKSHLGISVAKELMEKGAYIEVLSYTEFIIRVKQNMINAEGYSKMVNKYKICDVLVIDDFLKHTVKNGRTNETDLGIMFEIIDFRYKYKKPIILTSEAYLDEMFDISEAIAGRLKQMATFHGTNYVVEIAKEKERNYRLKGVNRV